VAAFDPISALVGGALIGLASVLLMLLTGRIAGISGILGGCLTLVPDGRAWRVAFIVGLVLAPVASGRLPLANAADAHELGDHRYRRLSRSPGHVDSGQIRSNLNTRPCLLSGLTLQLLRAP
jgi:uncharacterized membrane protein YedE/YeeE